MELGKILNTVGGTLLKNIVPGAGIIIDLVNGFLPADKKLDVTTATGTDVTSAVNTLPPEQKAQVLSKEFDVEIEEIKGFTTRFQSAMEADKTGNTTRPQIALMMGWIVSFSVVVSITALFIAIFTKDAATIKEMAELWPLMLAILATPTALLRAYFAMRTQEKEARYQAAIDQPIATGGMVGQIASMFKK
jgi:hypothetical protein